MESNYLGHKLQRDILRPPNASARRGAALAVVSPIALYPFSKLVWLAINPIAGAPHTSEKNSCG